MESQITGAEVIERILDLFERHGSQPYDGGRRESVSALEHALQSAQLAEWAGADLPLVAAALLHDIGDFDEGGAIGDDRSDNQHQLRALPWLAAAFGPEVLEPIRLHVAAKRYLVATEPAYQATLSPASLLSLDLQGGAMADDECQRFENESFSPQAVMLRRWDDAAKEPGKPTPSLAYFAALLQELQERARPAARRTVVGAFDA
ncbi:HD domain-containing protein [Aquabacterium sp.]|uniref:HD domain-containing protein n=1 Tax=Aquabacterium sp. TaxID=1872578 RepID=UPI002C50CA30|nr:HD domain-containing protein [Aquabacterium sp.]HSW08131.1 HD domain-containing protein [Aquabacterium sp.]